MQISKVRYAAKPKKQWITKPECDSQQLHTALPEVPLFLSLPSSASDSSSYVYPNFLNDSASSAICSTFLLNKKHHKLNILATKTNEWHKQQLHLNLATKHSWISWKKCCLRAQEMMYIDRNNNQKLQIARPKRQNNTPAHLKDYVLNG